MRGIDTVPVRSYAEAMVGLGAGPNISPVRILLVDDSELMRRCLRNLLEQQNPWWVCTEATNGREAIERAEQPSRI